MKQEKGNNQHETSPPNFYFLIETTPYLHFLKEINYKIMYNTLLLVTLVMTGCTSCKKQVDTNGLPPATQSGSNTMGFLLNGQAWTPSGYNGTANLSIDVDFGFKNGGFSIAAYRIITTNNRQDISFGIADSLKQMTVPIKLPLTQKSLFGIYFSNNTCDFYSTDSSVNENGSLTITKLDTANRIIAGIFNATLYQKGCDTIKITQGRFDMKF